MASGSDTPENLRARAVALRTIATKLEDEPALDVHQRAGADVWEGPTPRQCHADLLDVRRKVLNAAADLRRSARQLDTRAAELTPPPFGGPR